METNQLKQEMLSAISDELDQWLKESSQVKDGYEFEEKFLSHIRVINKVLLQKSVGKVPRGVNGKKNSTLALAK